MEEMIMKKFVCSVCGYVHEGDSAPERCPQCKVPAEKFNEVKGDMTWAAEHVVGVAKGVDPEIIAGLRAIKPAYANFFGYMTIGIIMAGGTALAMWIGERITKNGIGNGISLLIFAGIISNLFNGIVTATARIFNGGGMAAALGKAAAGNTADNGNGKNTGDNGRGFAAHQGKDHRIKSLFVIQHRKKPICSTDGYPGILLHPEQLKYDFPDSVLEMELCYHAHLTKRQMFPQIRGLLFLL